jgi:hypothetical protein
MIKFSLLNGSFQRVIEPATIERVLCAEFLKKK